jgi:hypothetical protein
MSSNLRRLQLLALFLGIIFLAAQFHTCVDLTPGPTSTHMCPVCSVAGAMVVTQSPAITTIPLVNRLEVSVAPVYLSFALPRAVSPRAPPAL